MALGIKSDEADQLARQLAAETGETLTEAVVTAGGHHRLRRRGPAELTQSSPESERGRSLVVDTSACVAVMLGEPGSEDPAACLEHALVRLMPAAIRVEVGIVIEARLWPAGRSDDPSSGLFSCR